MRLDFLLLQADVSVPDIQPHGEPIGIDVGLEKFLAVSNGILPPATLDAEPPCGCTAPSAGQSKIQNWYQILSHRPPGHRPTLTVHSPK